MAHTADLNFYWCTDIYHQLNALKNKTKQKNNEQTSITQWSVTAGMQYSSSFQGKQQIHCRGFSSCILTALWVGRKKAERT